MSEVGKSEIAKREEEVLAFWKEYNIFEKSLAKKAPKGDFIFYDGPPFATGLPHSGSLLSSIIKDVVPRYKTMRGYRVPRVWGWDCHGLPIESMVEKKLDLKAKKDILTIGIDVFNETARSMVLTYVDEWKKYVDRVGRWVDFKNSYKTMDNSYIESVWWALKRLNGKKLLYEGRKVLMYCTHCETPLAKAEIQQDNTYKDITEEAVVVKFKVKNPAKYNLPDNTYILAWTTTPWTLPGNVALAVGKDIEYALFQKYGEYSIASPESALFTPSETEWSLIRKIPAAELIGIEYEPLFDVPALQSNRSYKVYAADFVTTTDGTGIVHTAVMYGEDDFALGQKEKLPMVQLLTPSGLFNDAAPEFVRGQYLKKAQKDIIANLEHRVLLFAKEQHTHSYPHCYRCGTPLIYNAVASWFINIQKVKAKMLSENEKITWVPEHLKHGRFKKNVEQAPDWTISRNRFWASPLPIWKEKGGNRLMIVGSIDELALKTKKSGNTYMLMRHGQARSNVDHIFETTGNPENHLTDIGRDEVRASAQNLLQEKKKIDLIIFSPLVRTRETAKIVQDTYGLPDSAMMTDERLNEMQVGSFDGKSVDDWFASFTNSAEPFTSVPEGAETFTAIRQRVGDFLFEIERRYTNKNILIVTHKCPGWLLYGVATRLSLDEAKKREVDAFSLRTGEVKDIAFVPFPHNKVFDLDLHRPYIDAITLIDEKKRHYERIPEVIDCWVESGSMPFASAGYPKDKSIVNPERFFGLRPKGYPADFIAEYIAQTRTWFYYMHAMGTLLFKNRAFKNVVSTGTILASDGAKLSKSKGNYTDPLLLMEQFGADALRFYLMGSVVMQAEDLVFRNEDVREAHNRVVQMIWNCYKFFELYKGEYDGTTDSADSPHQLDRWLRARLHEVIVEVTDRLDVYDLPQACRVLREFIEDYSTWYLRRSRTRVKSDDMADKQYALAAQREALGVLAQLVAPIMPFIAESVYQGIEGGEGSVHLTSWPDASAFRPDPALVEEMQKVRGIVSLALQARESAGIKIRQPLALLRVKTLPGDVQLRALIADELNVKEVVEDEAIEGVWLDTTLTAQLLEEGIVRSLVRQIQEWRKQQNLTITDTPEYTLVATEEERDIAQRNRQKIIDDAGLSDLYISLK